MSKRLLYTSPELLQALGLHSGDVFHGSVGLDGKMTMTVESLPGDPLLVAPALRPWKDLSEVWLSEAEGRSLMTDDDIDDLRYQGLMEKHVWRHSALKS